MSLLCNCLYVSTLKIGLLTRAYTSAPFSWLVLNNWCGPIPAAPRAASSPTLSHLLCIMLSLKTLLPSGDPVCCLFYTPSTWVLVQVLSCFWSLTALQRLQLLWKAFPDFLSPRSGLSDPPTCSHGTLNFSSHNTFLLTLTLCLTIYSSSWILSPRTVFCVSRVSGSQSSLN